MLTVSSFFSGYIAYIFISWFYLYLVEVRGFTLLRGSFYAALPFVLTTVGFPLGGVLGDFFSTRQGTVRARRNVVIAGMLPASLLLYFGATVGNPIWAIAALSLTAGLGALTQSSYWVIAIESVPSRTATAVGITNTGFNLGGVCSPILTPWIAARYGWSTALTVAAIASVVVAILWKFIGDSTPAFGANFARPALHANRQRIKGTVFNRCPKGTQPLYSSRNVFDPCTM